MKSTILIVSIICLVAPVLLSKWLNYLDGRRWKKKLRGISDRYMTDEERSNQSFHMKRFR